MVEVSLLRIIAVANQKGGVGKTTSCVNLAAALGDKGRRVLVADLDPQGHSTSGLGIDKGKLSRSVYDVLINDSSPDEAISSTPWKGVYLLPARLELAGAEVELVGLLSRETRLAKALSKLKDFDLILIDCPPSLGLLTVNALVAAETVVVPIQCEYYALEGLSQLVGTVELVRRHLNERLHIGGVILTMYDSRTNLSKEVAEEVRKRFSDAVFETTIPRNVRLSEAPSYGQPVIYYDPQCIGAKAYMALAEEVEERWLNPRKL